MALTNTQIELHLMWAESTASEPCTSSTIREELVARFNRLKSGLCTGRESRPGETVFFLESQIPSRAVREIRTILAKYDVLWRSYVLLYDDEYSALPLRIEMREVDARLPEVRKLDTPRRQNRATARVFDYFAVPLPDGRYGHLQFVHRDPSWGDLVQVLARITDHPLSLDQLVHAEPLFPPVNSPVIAGLRKGGWIWLGNRALSSFEFPTFRNTASLLLRQHEPGIYDDWWLRSWGEDTWRFVGTLNAEQRKLEYEVTWPPDHLARRIATGVNEYDRFL